MKILFLTRKDSKHPFAWGAEKVIHEYAKGLVKLGHQVTWFAYTFPGASEKDSYDEIEIIRKFTLKTAYFLFPWWYKKHLQGRFDIIIDEAWGLPLLSPLYEKKTPIVFFAHHVGDKERDYAYPRPLNKIGKWIYNQFFKPYKNYQTITVSKSTKSELIQRFSFDPKKIKVIENACDIEPIDEVRFEDKKDRILFLGRLMPIKRAEDVIKAFAFFVQSDEKFSHYVLDIVGNAQDKKYVAFLKKTAKDYGVLDKVHFCGFIPREEFQTFISSHKVMLVPSMKEGFGLVVLEGNSYGVPVIGYDVAGVRDSIKNGINGFLVPDGDWKTMGEKLKDLICDQDWLYFQSQKALEYVQNLEWWWEKVKKFEQFLFSVVSDAKWKSLSISDYSHL